MDKEEIGKQVIEIISNELKELNRKIDIKTYKNLVNAEFYADLGLDSLKTVEIFMECENVFGIIFNDDEIITTKTVGNLINKINEKINI